MGKLLDLLKASAGERNLRNALGRWRQAVSLAAEAAQAKTCGSISAFDSTGFALDGAFVLEDYEELTPVVFLPGALTPDLIVNPTEFDRYLQYIGAPTKVLQLTAGVTLSVSSPGVRESFGLAIYKNGVQIAMSRAFGLSSVVMPDFNAVHISTHVSETVNQGDIFTIRVAEYETGALAPFLYSAYLAISE